MHMIFQPLYIVCPSEKWTRSFFPCTARLWNSVPAYCFPLSYNLHLFKANINMDLASLIITWKPTYKNIGNFISCLKSKLINWFEKWCPFLTYLTSYEVIVAATVYILALYCNTQSFIQAPLSVVVFAQRFSFFTVYLVQWLRGLAPWWIPKGSLFEFTSVDCCKTHFSWMFFFFFLNFRVLLRVAKKSLLERQLQPSFMHVTKE